MNCKLTPKTKLTLVFCIVSVILSSFSFAKENIDTALQHVCDDTERRLSSDAILCVMEFTTSKKEMSEYIQTKIMTSMVESGKIRVVTRSHLDKVNRELNFHMSGYVSDETALDICKKLGANAIIFGSLRELDNQYYLEVKMLDVESAAYRLFKVYEFSRTSKSEQLMGRAEIYYKTSISFGAEMNKNSVDKIAFGGCLSFDYAVLRWFELGAKVSASYAFFEKENSVFTIEPLGDLRFYLVSPTGEPASGIFVASLIGASVVTVDSDVKYSLNAGIELGFKHGWDNFYIEPYLRGGYPYIFGVGFAFGVRF